jgi:hypothetical protein
VLCGLHRRDEGVLQKVLAVEQAICRAAGPARGAAEELGPGGRPQAQDLLPQVTHGTFIFAMHGVPSLESVLSVPCLRPWESAYLRPWPVHARPHTPAAADGAKKFSIFPPIAAGCG